MAKPKKQKLYPFGLHKRLFEFYRLLHKLSDDRGWVKLSYHQIKSHMQIPDRTVRKYLTHLNEIRLIDRYTNTDYDIKTTKFHNRYTILRVYNHTEAVLLHDLYLKRKAEAKKNPTWNHDGAVTSNFNN